MKKIPCYEEVLTDSELLEQTLWMITKATRKELKEIIKSKTVVDILKKYAKRVFDYRFKSKHKVT